jgi:hypothetical protein
MQVDDWVVVQNRVLVLARTNFEAHGYAYTLAPASVAHTFHGDFLGACIKSFSLLIYNSSTEASRTLAHIGVGSTQLGLVMADGQMALYEYQVGYA